MAVVLSKATDIRLIDRWFSCTEPNGNKQMPGKEGKEDKMGANYVGSTRKASAAIEWNGEHLWLG